MEKQISDEERSRLLGLADIMEETNDFDISDSEYQKIFNDIRSTYNNRKNPQAWKLLCQILGSTEHYWFCSESFEELNDADLLMLNEIGRCSPNNHWLDELLDTYIQDFICSYSTSFEEALLFAARLAKANLLDSAEQILIQAIEVYSPHDPDDPSWIHSIRDILPRERWVNDVLSEML